MKAGRPKGFKPLNAKRPPPCMRDAGHAERRLAKLARVTMLGEIIREYSQRTKINFNYLRGVKRRYRKAQIELAAMRP